MFADDSRIGGDTAGHRVRHPLASAWFWAGCLATVGAWSVAAVLLLSLL